MCDRTAHTRSADQGVSAAMINGLWSRTFLVLLAVLALGLVFARRASALVLVEDGDPKATIVLGEKPSVSAQLAARELQHYVQKMSGATLPIVEEPAEAQGVAVLVGASKATESLGLKNKDFKHTEYLIETRGDKLILMGRDTPKAQPIDYKGDLAGFKALRFGQLGSCYAVHTLLEKFLDVRWYLPTELGEVVPEMKTISIPKIKIRRMPQASEFDPHPHGVNKRLHMPDYERAKEELEYDRDFDLRAGVLYFIRNKRWGCRPFSANHSFNGWGTAFGKDHPEWFSTNSWAKMQKIMAEGAYQRKIQQVLSNEGLIQKKVEIIRGYFDGKPEPFRHAYASARGNSFGILTNDSAGGVLWSQAPECVKQYDMDLRYDARLSRYFWNFVNRVAREVRKTHPKGEIIGLAYSWWTRPPRREYPGAWGKGIFRLEPNVSVMICRHPILYWEPGYKQEDIEDVEMWIRYGARNIYTWEYLLHPWVDSNPFPPVIPRINADDAKFLANTPGFRGGIMQFQYNLVPKAGHVWSHPVLDHFRLYFRLKLYDDKTLDVEEMLSEYYAKFYGPASGQVREFIEALEGRWCDKKVRKASGALPHSYGSSNARVWWEFLGTPDFIEKLKGLMAKAQKAAPAGSVYARRVDLLDKGIMQLIVNNRRNYAGSDMAKLPAIPEIDVPIGPAPTIDGRGDERLWQNVAWHKITRTNMNKGASAESRFKAVADGQNLYLLVECTERFTESIVAQMEGSGPAVLADDSLEIFIDKDPGDGKYYQLGCNTLGSVFELRIDRTGTEKNAATWKSDSKVKATLALNKNWTAEITIPWKNISGGAVTAGQTWRLNVCRNRRAGKERVEFTNWSVCGGGFHNPARFGKITFKAAGERGK